MSLVGQTYYAVCRTRWGHAMARRVARRLRWLNNRGAFRPPFDALELDHPAVAGLIRLWSRIHWSSGDGMMPAEQLMAIYKLAVAWLAEGDIVELGAWVGLTTSYLATACEVRGDGMVYAVDTFQGTKEGHTTYASIIGHGGSTLPAFQGQTQRAKIGHRVKPLVGLTTEVAGSYPGRPIRLLLIDADHSFEGVKGDFDSWLPYVARGGVIVFHDYLMPDVARFVETNVIHDSRVEAHPGRIDPNIFAVTKVDPGGLRDDT